MSTASTDAATRYEVRKGVATVTLNRPDNRNALSVELVNSLGDNLDAALADDAVRVVVLTNEGNTFCAGADLKAAQRGAAGPAEEPRHDFVEIFDTILGSPKPIVGKLNGHCLAGGLGLAASCDISIAREDALLGFSEVRIGVAPAVISVVCLPKMRRADSLELFLTGERVPATRAAEVGLINRAVPADELDEAVDELVGKVVLGGPKALEVSKQLVFRIPEMSRAEGFDWTRPLSAELFQSDEGQEGIAAFREKRNAAWVPD